MAFGEHLEDELGGAVRQRQVAEFVEDDELTTLAWARVTVGAWMSKR